MSTRTLLLSFVALSLVWASMLLAWPLGVGAAAGIGACVALACSLWLSRATWKPYRQQIDALNTLVAAWRDQDFSASIRLPDEHLLRELTGTLNQLGDVLRNERQALVQRELLLDTVIQNTPTAMVLLDTRGRVVYANTAARDLLVQRQRMEGLDWDEVLLGAPGPLTQALKASTDGLHTLPWNEGEEVFHVTRHRFRLQARPHTLILLRRLTRELARAEVATWKKVIRVISHELNNSLAPISSLSHSGRELLARGQSARVDQLLASIGERAQSLSRFIAGYARIAKLPQPRLEPVVWTTLINTLRQECEFRMLSGLPDTPWLVDRAQVEQLLINLLKNAHEANSPKSEVTLAVSNHGGWLQIEVADRGTGMSAEVLQQALLPFYSTKRNGSGLGLALAREIMDAHGGSIQLVNREGGGLLVSLRFPRQTEETGTDSASASASMTAAERAPD